MAHHHHHHSAALEVLFQGPERPLEYEKDDILPMELQNLLPRLEATVTDLKLAHKLDVVKIRQQLQWIHDTIIIIQSTLANGLFPSDFKEYQEMHKYMNAILERKVELFKFINCINEVEPVLSHILDLLEEDLSATPKGNVDFDLLFDLIENCTHESNFLTPNLKQLKECIDAAMEFNEISRDHMDTLDDLINKNVEKCFEIQELKFSSPVRHTPNFTLDQLIKLLSSNNNTTDTMEPKIPNFSPVEESLSRKFLILKRNIPPIEQSLTEILPQRIEQFCGRNIININLLADFLQLKYKRIMKNFRFMMNEIKDLKIELIDKRWNILFINLNNELEYIIEEVRLLLKKINENDDLAQTIKDRFNSQLAKKSKIITKTFNIIYRALEFSLLDAGIALKTNELAKVWVDLRPKSDEILLHIKKFDQSNSSR
nr:Chain A, Kar9 [Naumovozyma castellii CBS 4309]7AG9_B Chain B, Kar9 [Naumovozyma castellii CBS 4309]